MGSEKAVLSAADYILFTLMLLVSAAIGLYFRFSGGKQKTMNEYLLAGKNMPILPVAFSIMASYLSAITVIGTPAEIYLFGIHIFFSILIYPISVMIASYVCLPVFFKLGACTAYEVLYMAVVLYAPALALSAVTSLSTWASVISIGVVCTFYCTLGGMKAVLWTDLFQALLMFLGIFAVLIKGFLDMGFSEVFRIGYEGGRIAFPGFSLSLTERYTAWNVIFKGFLIPLMTFGANQVQIQRLLTLRNILDVEITSLHNRREDSLFVISVDKVSDPLFAERCRQLCEIGLNSALNLLVFLQDMRLGLLASSSIYGKDENLPSLSRGSFYCLEDTVSNPSTAHMTTISGQSFFQEMRVLLVKPSIILMQAMMWKRCFRNSLRVPSPNGLTVAHWLLQGYV
ncbi:Putative sodium-dependent multivitamin transporter [Araneus ventricosus]|uniref:Sodium-dependent multivitamin transporter n=1 Tax=Araneus ventricosus TaxID=182803 RepID=A0A4Y2PU20_ARAVE|nr:Putative sodium-dependent multivitamin transporter [Araneus ventricosus]